MATGDHMFTFSARANEPPSSAGATLDTRNTHPVLDFDAATDEEAVFSGVLPTSYGGNGLTVRLVWRASSATSGNVVWDAQIERWQDDTDDIDADSFAAVQSVTAATASVSGEPAYDNITFTSGAQMDSLAAGEGFRLKVRRDANNASDTMTGDAELDMVVVKET